MLIITAVFIMINLINNLVSQPTADCIEIPYSRARGSFCCHSYALTYSSFTLRNFVHRRRLVAHLLGCSH